MIYSQLLPQNPVVIPCEALTSPPVGRFAPSILLTCKHIFQEAIQCWGPTWSPRVLIDLKTGIDHSHYVNPTTERYLRWCKRNENSILRKILRVVIKGTGNSSILAQANPWWYTYPVRDKHRLLHTVKFLVKHFTDLLMVEVWPGAFPPEWWERPLLCLVDSIETIVTLNIEVVPGTDPTVKEDFKRIGQEINVIIQKRKSQKGLHSTLSESPHTMSKLRYSGLNMSQDKHEPQDKDLEDKNHSNEKRQEDEKALKGVTTGSEKHQENQKAFQGVDESGNKRQVEEENVQDQKLNDEEQRLQEHTLLHHDIGSGRERKGPEIAGATATEPGINSKSGIAIEEAARKKDQGYNGKVHTNTTEEEEEEEEEKDDDDDEEAASCVSNT